MYARFVAAAALMGASVQAHAATSVVKTGNAPTYALGSTPCALTDISPGATACQGWYEGNLNGGSTKMETASAGALNALLNVNSFTAATLTPIETLSNLTSNRIDFATPLYGMTVLAVHVGAAKGQASGVGYQSTAFYEFDAGNLKGGLNFLTFNRAGLSNAVLYSTGTYVTAVPEPATWATMILGVGAVGFAMRRRSRTRLSVAYA